MRTSFGLSSSQIEGVYEEFHFLKYYGNWSFHEAYSLPVTIRKWFVTRLLKQKEDEIEAKKKAIEKQTR
jgi:hypothetical protein